MHYIKNSLILDRMLAALFFYDILIIKKILHETYIFLFL